MEVCKKIISPFFSRNPLIDTGRWRQRRIPHEKNRILYRGISMSVPKMWGKQMLKNYQIWRIPPSPSLSFPLPFNEEEREGGRGPLKYLQQRGPKKWAHLPPSFFFCTLRRRKKSPPPHSTMLLVVGLFSLWDCRVWMQ